MKTNLFKLLTCLFAGVLIFASCEKSTKNQIVGTWELNMEAGYSDGKAVYIDNAPEPDFMFEFKSDGTFTEKWDDFSPEYGKYTIEKGALTLDYGDNDLEIYQLELSESGDKLFLSQEYEDKEYFDFEINRWVKESDPNKTHTRRTEYYCKKIK